MSGTLIKENTMTQPTVNTPKFTLEQVQWLDKVFPENINTKATSEELFINLGSRRVIKRLQSIYEDTKRNALK